MAHAGWRGLIDGVLEQVAKRISQDDDISQWMAAIGPSAGACCYEVDEPLVERFHQALPYESALISPRFRHLDLVAIAQAKLRGLGFAHVENYPNAQFAPKNVSLKQLTISAIPVFGAMLIGANESLSILESKAVISIPA